MFCTLLMKVMERRSRSIEKAQSSALMLLISQANFKFIFIVQLSDLFWSMHMLFQSFNQLIFVVA